MQIVEKARRNCCNLSNTKLPILQELSEIIPSCIKRANSNHHQWIHQTLRRILLIPGAFCSILMLHVLLEPQLQGIFYCTLALRIIWYWPCRIIKIKCITKDANLIRDLGEQEPRRLAIEQVVGIAALASGQKSGGSSTAVEEAFDCCYYSRNRAEGIKGLGLNMDFQGE